MDVKKDYELRKNQRSMPLVWVVPLGLQREYQEASDAVMFDRFGPGRSMRLNTYGHEEPGNRRSVHLIAVRGGTTLHIDPAYVRYSHQFVIRNDGWYMHGLDERLPDMPLLAGVFICLDTHSPHKVSRDPRFGSGGPYYVAIAVDADEPLEPGPAWELIAERALHAV